MASGVSVYVGSLPYAVTEEELRGLFAGAGEVSALRIIMDRDTGLSKGFAFVEFADPAAAQRAIELFNGHRLGERTLVVNEAQPRGEQRGREWRTR
jgi:RNA recognition motif-containing protein